MAEGVLIVGGGFAGFWAALAAKRVAGSRAVVTLVSREPVLEIRPRLYEEHPEQLGVDLRPLLERAGVAFLQGEAATIDVKRRGVVLSTGQRLGYQRLVVATGSRMRRPPVPGADTAYSIDTMSEAVAFDRRLQQIVKTSGNPSIAIVGAGFTGIELALELRDRLASHGGEALAERARIILLDRADTVGPELGSGPRATIEAALASARVELCLSANITRLAVSRITLATSSPLDVDAVVITTGMVAASFAAQVPGERDGLGRVVVENTLRAPAAPDIFVTGDSAAADTGNGHRALQSCQHALQLGRFAGENAARDLLGMPMVPYSQLRYVTCLDLGRSGAVLTQGWERAVAQAGPETKALKQRINRTVIYPPLDAPGDTLLALSSTDPAQQQRPAS
ncbi:FAD-dependent oxidoreductase [Thalassobaculum sp.]|uniref:NAD(P)/FAD-dependent oxidoreductase n=1 Tax=Thalassobaculum sp. TaxID=2022740 RepID=UPI0032EB4670